MHRTVQSELFEIKGFSYSAVLLFCTLQNHSGPKPKKKKKTRCEDINVTWHRHNWLKWNLIQSWFGVRFKNSVLYIIVLNKNSIMLVKCEDVSAFVEMIFASVFWLSWLISVLVVLHTIKFKKNIIYLCLIDSSTKLSEILNSV